MSGTGMDIAELTGALFVKIEAGGKEYKLIPATVGDHADLAAEMREEKRKEAARVLRDLKGAGVEDKIAVAEYIRLYDRGESLKRLELEIALSRHALRGVRYYFLACARKHHPELTAEAVKGIVTAENYRTIDLEMQPLFPQPKPEPKVEKTGEGEEKKVVAAEPTTPSPR